MLGSKLIRIYVSFSVFPAEMSIESPPASAPAATPALSVNSQDASSLVNLLSKVDVSPSDLLSALSKVQSQSSFGGEKFRKCILNIWSVTIAWLKNIFSPFS